MLFLSLGGECFDITCILPPSESSYMYSCQLEFTPLHQSSFIYIKKKQKKNEKNKRKKDVLSIFKKKKKELDCF